jgi:hypothetical protein
VASGWLGLDWGNVPTWVGATITSTSVFIAALSYRRSVSDKEREQASHVAAWVGVVEDSGKSRRVLRVTNGSDASVYEITAKVQGSAGTQLAELPAKTTTTVDLISLNQKDTRSSSDRKPSTISARMSFWMIELEGTGVAETVSQEPAPELEFRDAVGRWWQRMPDGRLKHISNRSSSSFRFSEVRARYRIPLLGSIEFKTSRPTED